MTKAIRIENADTSDHHVSVFVEVRRRLIVQAMYPDGDLRRIWRLPSDPLPRVDEVLQRVVAPEEVPDEWLDVPLIALLCA